MVDDDNQAAPTADPAALPVEVTWTASEFIAHDKSASWYAGLVAVTVIIGFVVYSVSQDLISIAVVIVGALMFGVYGSHKPRQLEYRLDQYGIAIGAKSYSYGEFRSFSVIPEGAFSSIVLMPLKRFGAPITIYYAPQDEDKIMSLLSLQLPFEKAGRDMVDSLMRRIRF